MQDALSLSCCCIKTCDISYEAHDCKILPIAISHFTVKLYYEMDTVEKQFIPIAVQD